MLQRRFEKADRLFCHGRFEDALVELEALETHYPDNHRILNAQAHTLDRLRQYDRTLTICNRLLDDSQYEKVRPLRDNVTRSLENNMEVSPSDGKKIETNDDEKRFKIKPIRMLLLIGICGVMYMNYLPT